MKYREEAYRHLRVHLTATGLERLRVVRRWWRTGGDGLQPDTPAEQPAPVGRGDAPKPFLHVVTQVCGDLSAD